MTSTVTLLGPDANDNAPAATTCACPVPLEVLGPKVNVRLLPATSDSELARERPAPDLLMPPGSSTPPLCTVSGPATPPPATTPADTPPPANVPPEFTVTGPMPVAETFALVNALPT